MLSPYLLDKYFDKLLDVDYSTYYTSNQYSQTSNDKEVVIEMAVPGISREDLKIDVVENILTVEAKPKVKSRFAKELKQSWDISKDIDVDGINAELKNGLLTLVLPKFKPLKKTVNISIS
jgi:HSP20 family protein